MSEGKTDAYVGEDNEAQVWQIRAEPDNHNRGTMSGPGETDESN